MKFDEEMAGDCGIEDEMSADVDELLFFDTHSFSWYTFLSSFLYEGRRLMKFQSIL